MAVDSLDQFSPILPDGGDADDPADSPADPPADPPDVPNPADDPPNLADDDDASPDDDASLDDDSPDDSLRNPQDSLEDDPPQDPIAAAAAVQAASRAQSARRSADVADVSLQIAAAHQRDVLETKISERVGGINGQIESAERDGARFTETEEVLVRRRMELMAAIMTKASIVMLMVTAGLTIYLVTLWHSLPLAVRCAVVVTFAWLAGAMTTIALQYSAGEDEGEDDETARGQWLADDHSPSPWGRSSPGTAVEPWQNKMMKSASVTFLLLLVTVAFVQYSPRHPCSAHKTAVDAYCDDDQSNMDECFSTCMDERGTQDDVIDLIGTPPCPQLADSSCACIKRCASRSSSDACSKAMIARLECNLANEHGCMGHACPKSSFAWTGTRMEKTKDVAVRLRNAGTGKEKDATFANGGLGATEDVPTKLHKAGIRNEKDATSASRELVARAVVISAKLRKMGA